jgi:uridine phosphorylase
VSAVANYYHIGFDDTHGALTAILTGDPARVPDIAAHLENPRYHATSREYVSWLGELMGERVLVMSTGMGGPSMAIAVEELYMSGVRTFVRIGTCGGMAERVRGGDIVIANAAIRVEGTSKEYVPVEFPAVSDIDVTNALISSAKAIGATYHVGTVHCKDSFYGQHDPSRMPVGYELEAKWDAWIRAGCLASEMESAALFIVAQTLGVRAGCVLHTIWNQERKKSGTDDEDCFDTSTAVKIAIDAVKALISKID